MRQRTGAMLSAAVLGVAVIALFSIDGRQAKADDPNSAPNPYHVVDHWAKLPPGRTWGQAIGIDIDPDGTSVWVYDRCGGQTCVGSSVAPIQKLDATGKVVTSFGAGSVNWPHGLGVDQDGNVWVTDGKAENGKGQTAIKFSPSGKVLMTIGTPGVAGDGPNQLNGPSDVIVAPNGNIFIADGHGEKTNDRIVEYSKDGKLIKAWGHHGSGQGEFNVPHGLAMDSAGRLYVADRSNNRIQIFDADGKFIAEWKQFGRPSGVYIRNDVLYACDSQSNEKTNPPFRQGIRIGSVKDGKVTAFISAPAPGFEMPEGCAADKSGNVFGGFTAKSDVKKYAKN
ncbi:MAG TPA: peptidyl-alpha-hydroxyglycine alpha-amidating lyase family protein [Xanthobacteraceae bacterium]|nr:peptidyl-alpha-hydroxyglycine alpha-amidating lyase family protein [Xanthobacteraceae bacterium]